MGLAGASSGPRSSRCSSARRQPALTPGRKRRAPRDPRRRTRQRSGRVRAGGLSPLRIARARVHDAVSRPRPRLESAGRRGLAQREDRRGDRAAAQRFPAPARRRRDARQPGQRPARPWPGGRGGSFPAAGSHPAASRRGRANPAGPLVVRPAPVPRGRGRVSHLAHARPGFGAGPLRPRARLSAQDRLEEAKAAYRQALARQPGHPEAFAGLGALLIRQQRLAEAEALCREALARDPGRIDSHYDLGTILTKQGRLAEARGELSPRARPPARSPRIADVPPLPAELLRPRIAGSPARGIEGLRRARERPRESTVFGLDLRPRPETPARGAGLRRPARAPGRLLPRSGARPCRRQPHRVGGLSDVRGDGRALGTAARARVAVAAAGRPFRRSRRAPHPRRRRSRPDRPVRPHRAQPPARLRVEAGSRPGHLAGLFRDHRPRGDGFHPGGPGRPAAVPAIAIHREDLVPARHAPVLHAPPGGASLPRPRRRSRTDSSPSAAFRPCRRSPTKSCAHGAPFSPRVRDRA